ncbi:hypothetical protein ASG31_05255 [Chryseobacterium sp. Leaf404]|uniref:hypothetical protein n=1 Tax=unclassified Chryseobacterium TaxID=2593645 RepID=UPI0006F67F0D|nr:MULTISPECIES: hypothetical protein [unclassified Chryseobacterium]KQT18142.1 hypothetical protein ASG31_05255 [Chryseobacterium sp. Leaf404]
MEVNNLLKSELTLPAESIENVIVKYPKKKIIEGMISESQFNPFKIQISQRDMKDMKKKFHDIDFENALEIAIYFYGGKISVHKDSKYTD